MQTKTPPSRDRGTASSATATKNAKATEHLYTAFSNVAERHEAPVIASVMAATLVIADVVHELARRGLDSDIDELARRCNGLLDDARAKGERLFRESD